MNIVEAFNKLKENPDLVIKCKGIKYNQILGDIYHFVFDNNMYSKMDIKESWFSLEEILSNDWEVIEK